MLKDKDLIKTLKPSTVTILGIPLDKNSSFMKGAASGPSKIREKLHCGSTNLCAENGISLEDNSRFIDLGDMRFTQEGNFVEDIEQTIIGLLSKGAFILSLGGDHSITYPVVKAYHNKYKGLNILHIDAHPDLYEEYDGNRFSHASPFARIMESNLVNSIVQVGIRTMNPHQRAQADRFGVRVIEMKDWYPDYPMNLEGPLYISLDIDAIDPAYAPGVSHHEPGGLATREVIRIIQRLDIPIVGADIVELNSLRDINNITAMTVVKLLKELAGKIIEINS